MIFRRVNGDTVHPGIQLALPFKVINMPENFDKGILQHVVRIVMGNHHPPDMPVQPLLIFFQQYPECRILARHPPETHQQLRVNAFIFLAEKIRPKRTFTPNPIVPLVARGPSAKTDCVPTL